MSVGLSFLNYSCKFVMRRNVSTKYLRPHPRPYRRRLYEKALEPILPSELERKKQILEEGDIFDFQPPPNDPQDYSEYELAEVAMIRSWIKEEQFRLIGFCQVSHVNESTQWLTQNQFRLKGLEYKMLAPKIMRKLFENAPFQTLNVMFDDHTAFLFGKDEESLRVLVNESAKHNWLTLLAATLDQRVIGIDTLEKLAKLPSVDSLRAETARILDQISHGLVQTLDHSSHELSRSLAHFSAQ